MSYFCIFNKRGCILFEEGKQPPFINSLVTSIDLSRLTNVKTIRDMKVEYEIRGPIIYLSVGLNKDIRTLIDIKKQTLTENNKIKNKKREEITKSESLNYSDLSVSNFNYTNVVEKKKKTYTFNLFSNKIHVSELKDKMELHLVKKNVDYEIAKILSECVINQLKEEKQLYVSASTFKKYMSDIIAKLIPSIDHENFIKNMKKSNSVFAICFIGVNGVGKSTSLAKICCWLLENNLKVYIAACDTFRAGAIEQLKIHVDRFKQAGHDVGFFEKGYGRDDATVARMAIDAAQKGGYDVILIDTAGRMHNKKPLMDSLSKLIRYNEPDHIVYVGEALVGSDSLSHIKEFNCAVKNGNELRKIDSIMLTKVDTVDDKIGQILNMAFTSHAPILFLGNGQTNIDVVKIASNEIVDSLLS